MWFFTIFFNFSIIFCFSFFYLAFSFFLFVSHIHARTYIIFFTRDDEVKMLNVYFTDRTMEEPTRKAKAIAILKEILIKNKKKKDTAIKRHEEKCRNVSQRLKSRNDERLWVSLLLLSWAVTISKLSEYLKIMVKYYATIRSVYTYMFLV